MSPMLRTAGLFGGLVLGLFLVLSFSMSQLAAAADPTPESKVGCNNVRTVSVTGAATINVVPDRVLVKLGVEVKAPTSEKAMDLSVQRVTAVIAAVRALGIAEQDISTDYYQVYPYYTGAYYGGVPQLESYSVTNSLAVTLKDANLLDELLIAAFKAGANHIHQTEFSTSELRRYRDEARTLAMQAAREKAELLVEAGDAELGCVLTISEQSASWYSGSWWGGRDLSTWAQNTVQNAAAQQPAGEGEDGPVSLGHIAVKAEISASYSLE